MNFFLKVLINTFKFSLLTIILSKSIFAQPILINANRDYYPATYMKGKEWYGMDIDIFNEIFLRAKLDFKIVEIPFKRSLYWMQSGKTHMMPNLSKNEERSAYMYWLGPIRITAIGLVVLKKDQHLPINTCDDLIIVSRQRNRKFGYLNGASYSDYFDNRIEKDPAIKNVLHFTSSPKQSIAMLQKGRVIGFFQDDFEIQHLLLDQSNNHASLYNDVALHSYRIEGSHGGAYIGISKKLDKILYKKIITAFQSIKDDGTFEKIHIKWTGKKSNF